MRKKIVYSFVLLFAVIAQTSILPVFFSNQVLGDAVLMAVLAWAMLDGFQAFIGWAIVAGIFYDLAAYSPIGEHVLIFLVVVYFVSFFSKRLSLNFRGTGLFLFFIFVIAVTVFSEIVLAIFAVYENQAMYEYWRKFGGVGEIMLKIICNEILFFGWFILLKKIKKFFKLETI
ncbi:MAG TPA: rod shape-determining protein MreD [Candidatus Moranbacteria bacterium]|nr:rod shape-determining protein MreD [Candidatus Moranbacteria bacterium]